MYVVIHICGNEHGGYYEYAGMQAQILRRGLTDMYACNRDIDAPNSFLYYR